MESADATLLQTAEARRRLVEAAKAGGVHFVGFADDETKVHITTATQMPGQFWGQGPGMAFAPLPAPPQGWEPAPPPPVETVKAAPPVESVETADQAEPGRVPAVVEGGEGVEQARPAEPTEPEPVEETQAPAGPAWIADGLAAWAPVFLFPKESLGTVADSAP